MGEKHNYDFRNQNLIQTKRLNQTLNALEAAGCALDESWEIITKETDSRLVKYFSGNLCEFLGDGFGVYLRVRRVENVQDAMRSPLHKIFLFEEKDVENFVVESEMQNAFHITVTSDNITIIGKSERGTAQGVYYMEDHMKLRGECAIAEESKEHSPLFSPRMTHSGMELDTFPDTFLEACAHAGMDAIIVYAGHVDTNLHGFPDPDPLWPGSCRGYCDYNNLVWRAAGYGLDVYIYSHFICDVHPRDKEAKAYYEASFGTLFQKCPGLKGIIFVGETFEFPSLDPHTCGCRFQKKKEGEILPSPGWYPCFDYSELVTMVRDIIFQYRPDADIVFWSYNWGDAPKEARLELIRNLPRDISLLVTFEMYHALRDESGKSYTIDDYSISFAGPSQVYLDEAQEAKKCGIRLYSMANTGGRTWDNGIVPYIPVPQQWQRRYEQLRRSHEEHGLCGLMENHHYGWLPSFLTLFEKNAFTSNSISDDEMLRRIAVRDFGTEADKAIQAWELFSEGIRSVVAAKIDQYGPYRSGPAYPLLFDQKKEELIFPSVEWAWQRGFGIWDPIYVPNLFENPEFTVLRYKHVQEVEDCFRCGCELLEAAVAAIGAVPGTEPSRQAAVARFMHCTYVTAYHVMGWTIAKNLLIAKVEKVKHGCEDALFACIGLEDRDVDSIVGLMQEIAQKETENVHRALLCYREDSSIGFEPSMEYVFDTEHAAWKNEETRRSLERLKSYLDRCKI